MARRLSRMERLESRLDKIVRRYDTIAKGDLIIAKWRAWRRRQQVAGVR